MKVCHLTDAHKTTDDRIYLKECQSLAQAGYEVYLIGQGESFARDGVNIIGVGEMPNSRRRRMTKGAKCVFEKALSLDCDVYHFHDPELLPYGLKLKKLGKTVIFDSHEDVPAQIMDKKWIPLFVRKVVSRLYRTYETYVVKRIDAVVTATPYIAEQFAGRAKQTVIINNYPKMDDILFHTTPFSEREPIICYAGGINEMRGEKVMVEVMKDVGGILILAGDHEIQEIKHESGGVVRYVGRLDRNGVNDLYGKAVVGLCVLKPMQNYYYSQPIKMYEYMAAGIPFICSDFPGWRKVAEESGGGVYVAFDDYDGIEAAIRGFLADRQRAQEMGQCGHDYVITHCSWINEERKLIALYNALRGGEPSSKEQ